MADFHTVQGDLEPSCTEILYDVTDEPMDFAGATLLWRAKHRVTGQVVSGTPVTTGNPGELRYSLTAGQSDVAGEYDYCWVVTVDNRPQTVPNDGTFRHWRNRANNS